MASGAPENIPQKGIDNISDIEYIKVEDKYRIYARKENGK